MDDQIAHITELSVRATAFVLLFFVVLLLAKWLKDILTPYSLNRELVQNDNLAVAMTMSGYYLGVSAVFVGALTGPSQGLIDELVATGGYSLFGIGLLNASRYINDRFILNQFSNDRQLIEERNVAVGAVQFGTYVATGLIIASCVAGDGGGEGPVMAVAGTVVFFVLGQLSLLLFSRLYDLLSSYRIQQELANQNVSAGVAYAGTLIALGIIIANGIYGESSGWLLDLVHFAGNTVLGFVFLPIIRYVMDRLVVSGDNLSREIREDRNIGAGLLAATVAISFALVLRIVM